LPGGRTICQGKETSLSLIDLYMKLYFLVLTLLVPLLFPLKTKAQTIGKNPDPTVMVSPILEDFHTLENWETLLFPKIPRHSTYEIVDLPEGKALELRSDHSASAKVYRKSFDPYLLPRLSWRWKIYDFPHRKDPQRKEGDDYPVRIYVLFTYDPANPGSAGRFKYELAKLLYGIYPPHSSLNFVWANHRAPRDRYPNPYTDRAIMIVRDRGQEAVGQWREHEIDIIEEYRKSFGEDPPRKATLAVMADTDNTATRSLAWIDYIHVEPSSKDLLKD